MKIKLLILLLLFVFTTNGLYAKTIKNPFTKKRQYITGFTDTGTINFTLSDNDITAIVNPDLVIDSLVISNSEPPTNATAIGTTGQVTWDAEYIYVCIATNTWKRSSIVTWAVTGALLLESGDFLLLETGDQLLLD